MRNPSLCCASDPASDDSGRSTGADLHEIIRHLDGASFAARIAMASYAEKNGAEELQIPLVIGGSFCCATAALDAATNAAKRGELATAQLALSLAQTSIIPAFERLRDVIQQVGSARRQ